MHTGLWEKMKDLSVKSRIVLKWANEIGASACADSLD
jgi:hypothetical protein